MIVEKTKWKTIMLGDYVKIVNGCSYKRAELKRSDIALVTLKSINRGGGFNQNGYKEYVGKYDEKQVIKNGEIVMAITDLTQNGVVIGRPAIVKLTGKYTKVIASLDLQIIRSNILSEKYIYYLLLTDKFHNYSLSYANGTTVLHLNKNAISKFKTSIPPFKEQQHIAKILSCLDAKIENLQKMNKMLEQMGHTIFKSWFVDYEFPDENGKPYRSSGGKMVYNEHIEKKIPEEWQVMPIDKIADFLNGLALQKYSAQSEKYLPVIKIKELKHGVTESSDRADPSISEEYVVDDGDVLFSWSGSLEVVIWAGGKGALNQHLFKVTSKTYPKWFYYYWILQYLSHYRHIAADKATTMGHIQRYHLNNSLALLPTNNTLSKMNNLLCPLLEQNVSLNLEINKLVHIRDLLIPKLMSGKIRVPVTIHNEKDNI